MLQRIPTALMVPFAMVIAGLFFQPPQAAAADTARQSASDSSIDPEIATAIADVRAFDNHAHPVLPPPREEGDRDFDALPVDEMEPYTDLQTWRPDNPQILDAWRALWGFDAAALPLDAERSAALDAARQRVKEREGEHFAVWVLEQSGIGVMAANRVALGAGIAPPRFRWVPYVDALVFPLDDTQLASATPDRKSFFALEDQLRSRYLEAVGLKRPPATLDRYLAQVVTPTLERQKRGGAIAVKFEIAYLRSFDVAAPTHAAAARIYAQHVGETAPRAADYKTLEDYLFRYIAAECGRLGLAVHIHTMSGGGGYFDIAGGNPLLLEPLFDDPHLRHTRFVLLHGGWPFVREAGALLQKPNVYLDLSQQSMAFAPRTLAGWLREWLETFPSKVLYGTDAYPFSAAMGWPESAWVANHNAREALGLALSGMLADGEISRPRAVEIARGVLVDNAVAIYGASAVR